VEDRPKTNIPDKDKSAENSGLGLICRLFWFFIGNIILFILAAKIALLGSNHFNIFDIFYWITVLGLIISRYIDIRYCKGETASSEPATMAHWKRYSVFAVSICTGLWIFSHIISHFYRIGF
jgi:hypothetical protein